MTETIGLKEGWIEKGLTEEQMMNRIEELNLPIPWCSMEPYPLNFLQTPDLNSSALKKILEMRKLTADTGAWIAASNLWTPGQTINIVFSNSTHMEFIKATLIKYLQPHVSMKLVFPSGSSGDIVVNVTSLSGQGGNSAIGKTGRQQTVNLSGSSMSNADINYSGKFSWARYLVCHEFGHAMGLYHEWNRENCSRNGITCSGSEDSYSVMNYPVGSSGGASDAKPSPNCMDNYSPNDIQWLEKVYGKGTGNTQQPSTRPQTSSIRPQPPSIRPQPPSIRPQPPSIRPQPPSIRPPPPSTTKPPPPSTTKPPPPSTTKPPPPSTTKPPSTLAPPVGNSNNMIVIIIIISVIILLLIVLISIALFKKKTSN